MDNGNKCEIELENKELIEELLKQDEHKPIKYSGLSNQGIIYLNF